MKQAIRYTIVVMALLLPVVGFAREIKLFDRLDADKDGALSRDELVKSDLVVVNAPKGKKKVVLRNMTKDTEAVPLTEEQKQRLFDQIDRNKDGHISRKEWNRASPNGFILWKF